MGKLLLAAVLACSSFGGMSDDAQGTIGIDPIPPHQGGQMTVTTPGPWPQKVTVEFDPGAPFTVTVGANGVDVQVPANATSVVVTDPAGILAGNGSVVAP